MKNVVKKSKFVILPALATLVLTGVASVTGTVAWFTANRTATLTGTQFQAKALDSTLKMTVKAITGTTGDSTSPTSSESITVDGLLTHGSFDITSKTAFNALTSDHYVTGYRSVGALSNDSAVDGWKAGEIAASDSNSKAKSVWYAVSWKISFTQTLNSETETVAVLFNPSASTYSDNQKVNAGFETAMFTMSDDSTVSHSLVFGNDNHRKHVASAGNGNITYTKFDSGTMTFDKNTTDYFTRDNNADTYSKVLEPNEDDKNDYYVKSYDLSSKEADFDHYFQSDARYLPLSDKDTKLTSPSTKEYLGTLDKAHTSLDVYCVAWYEGTDPAVVTNNVIDAAITSTLGFYSRII